MIVFSATHTRSQPTASSASLELQQSASHSGASVIQSLAGGATGRTYPLKAKPERVKLVQTYPGLATATDRTVPATL